MAIPYECLECGRTGRVKDSLLGKRIKCPGCSKCVTVGAPPPENDSGIELIEEDDEDYGLKQEKAAPRPVQARRPRRTRERREADSDGSGILGTLLYYFLIFLFFSVGNYILHHYTGYVLIPRGRF